MRPITGEYGSYRWINTECELRDFLALCPEAILGKRLAVTSIDGASLVPTSDELQSGWRSAKGVAYSPPIHSLNELPNEAHKEWCDFFHEWYTFDEFVDLGEVVEHSNIFEDGPRPGRVFRFATFLGFALRDRGYAEIVKFFWKQMDFIQPDSYIGDGDRYLSFATRSEPLFEEVVKRLRTFQPRRARVGRVPVPRDDSPL